MVFNTPERDFYISLISFFIQYIRHYESSYLTLFNEFYVVDYCLVVYKNVH